MSSAHYQNNHRSQPQCREGRSQHKASISRFPSCSRKRKRCLNNNTCCSILQLHDKQISVAFTIIILFCNSSVASFVEIEIEIKIHAEKYENNQFPEKGINIHDNNIILQLFGCIFQFKRSQLKRLNNIATHTLKEYLTTPAEVFTM